MAVKCNICGTTCVSCRGGRCKCDFSEKEASLSNDVYSKYNIDLSIPGLIDYYKQTIKSSGHNKYTKEDIANLMYEYKVPERYSKKEIIKEIKTEVNQGGICEYPSGNLSAWDVCIYCGTARFYGQNKPCSGHK